jgi:hypothetical protein
MSRAWAHSRASILHRGSAPHWAGPWAGSQPAGVGPPMPSEPAPGGAHSENRASGLRKRQRVAGSPERAGRARWFDAPRSRCVPFSTPRLPHDLQVDDRAELDQLLLDPRRRDHYRRQHGLGCERVCAAACTRCGAVDTRLCDVSNREAFEATFAATLAEFGRIDACFASAGVGGGDGAAL